MSVERRSGRKTAFLAATATFSTFLIIALVAAWSVFYAPGPAAREGESTIVSLPSGAGVSAIAATLKSAGVIRSTDMFKAAATLTGADRKLRAGEYEVPDKASLRSVLVLLVEGRVVRHYVTLPEGWSSAQAVEILNKQAILTGTIDAIPAEASLWPDTYEISRGETRASVIGRMRRARDENLARLWAARGPATVVRTPEEAMILASIVEKETGVAAERPRVAAVFTNRLRSGMRLERPDHRIRHHQRGAAAPGPETVRAGPAQSVEHLPDRRTAPDPDLQSRPGRRRRRAQSALDQRPVLRRRRLGRPRLRPDL